MNWVDFLKRNRIPYSTRGPNSSRGRVQIKCPYCTDDPSDHLGIVIKTGKWNCWRNPHVGIIHDGVHLAQTLLRCSEEEARARLGEAAPALAGAEGLRASFARITGGQAPMKMIGMPDDFLPLNNGSPFAAPYIEYLKTRGYEESQIAWLTTTYDLHYARKGKFQGRIIIPVKDRSGNLLTWTGRTVRREDSLRYRTLSNRDQLASTKESLLGLPLLWRCTNPRVLVICEGPFDAMWISTYGRTFGVYGTCLFGLTLQREQTALLAELRERFERQVLILDSSARRQAFRLAHSGLDIDTASLPNGVKDPAELTANQAVELCVSLL